MEKIEINSGIILSTMIFSLIFLGGVFLLIDQINNLAYQIILALVLVIIYVNFLRLFVFEMCSLKKTRATEIFFYIIMYIITAGAFIFPLVLEPRYFHESPVLRIIIIVFATILLFKYFLYMILGPIYDIIYKIKHHLFFDHKKYEPFVSVMIPAWNEEVGIIDTINSLLNSNYRYFEIIVINDGSTDNSDKLISSFVKGYNSRKNSDIKIRYFYQKNTGKGGALNNAINLANGEILMSIDADCVVSREAIGAFVDSFKNPKTMAAVGNVKIADKDNYIGVVQYLEFLFSFYFKRAEALLGSIYIIGGAAGAFRKEVFEKIGGYNTTNITEDIELTVRIQDAGMKIDFVPDAIVYTEGANDLEGLKKQRLRWKRGRFQTFYQHMYMFFSTKKRHNKFLTFFTMPMAIVQEIQLILEIPFIIFLYVFSVVNSDYTSFMTGVIVVGVMFAIQFMFYDKSVRNIHFVLLAPIGWIIFYIATYVEARALIESIYSFVAKKNVSWQTWDRRGISVVKKDIT